MLTAKDMTQAERDWLTERATQVQEKGDKGFDGVMERLEVLFTREASNPG